jgi:hypothetical protein
MKDESLDLREAGHEGLVSSCLRTIHDGLL